MLRAGLRSCLFYGPVCSMWLAPSGTSGRCSRRLSIIPASTTQSSGSICQPPGGPQAGPGDAGELERAFGRTLIGRIPCPPAWERIGAGRRFFVFPGRRDGAG